MWIHTSHHILKSTKNQTDQNLKPKTVKCLEENIRENLRDFGASKDFLHMTQKYNLKSYK